MYLDAVTTFELTNANVKSVTIEHSVSSSVDLVGLQVREREDSLLSKHVSAHAQ